MPGPHPFLRHRAITLVHVDLLAVFRQLKAVHGRGVLHCVRLVNIMSVCVGGGKFSGLL